MKLSNLLATCLAGAALYACSDEPELEQEVEAPCYQQREGPNLYQICNLRFSAPYLHAEVSKEGQAPVTVSFKETDFGYFLHLRNIQFLPEGSIQEKIFICDDRQNKDKKIDGFIINGDERYSLRTNGQDKWDYPEHLSSEKARDNIIEAQRIFTTYHALLIDHYRQKFPRLKDL